MVVVHVNEYDNTVIIMFGKNNNNRKNDRSSHSRDRTTVGVYVNEDDINI